MKKALACILFISAFLMPLMAQESEEPGIYARFTTVKGELLFKLNYEELPLTVSNFVALCEGKIAVPGSTGPYYDKKKISRLIDGYALFIGTEEDGVDYSYPRERGSSMSSGIPGTLMMVSRQGKDHGSRLMILIAGDEFLDQKYTAFGSLVSGEKVLSKLKRGDMIQSVEIQRIGSDAQSFMPGDEDVRTLITQARQVERDLFTEENPAVANVLNQLGDNVQESETGIFYRVFKEGSGSKPRPGNTVRMHYSGKLLNGQEFDNSYMRGEPFQFTIGEDSVIPGWVESALSMQAGEQRVIILPPALAYGDRGFGPIPPNSWLIFELQLIDFQ